MMAVYSLDADDFTIAPEILLVLVHEGIMITHQKQLYYMCTTLSPPPPHSKKKQQQQNTPQQNHSRWHTQPLKIPHKLCHNTKKTLGLHTQAHKTHWKQHILPHPSKKPKQNKRITPIHYKEKKNL